ncbi:MAG TPA: 5'/3'-nucleotidase SurE [Methanothrix sp.]|jgi:5'-nucleotidase|nr:5'/3'-nucleotidase SurE [Methanothrix sp.]HOV82314.1 5'/3'-nucleotidase SurE [Methanothrix sp.]HPC89719.1 5'/3'-nucleotidase SurE [Methanothrix sp.]HQI68898.1 5'/3'-nucleotidase SurE [Methanothrix sp.]HRS85153.1 5'/3'-nucleotidase SurE [Methanothrix sp.]
MPRILVSNDDGVYAAGLQAAAKSVQGLGQVVVAAPSGQKSGVGRSVSVFEPLRYVDVNLNGFRAYAVTGTPVDSVVIGIFAIMKGEMPDLVVSGINVGENISTDTVTTSGTIGAALEAASYGIPAIAASLQAIDQGDKFDMHHGARHSFDVATTVLRRVASRVLEKGLPQGVDLLNLNVPVSATEDTEIVVTRLARKIFKTAVEERFDPRGRAYYWIDGDLICCDEEGTDVQTLYQDRKISLTPLSLDSTARIDFKEIEGLF